MCGSPSTLGTKPHVHVSLHTQESQVTRIVSRWEFGYHPANTLPTPYQGLLRLTGGCSLRRGIYSSAVRVAARLYGLRSKDTGDKVCREK